MKTTSTSDIDIMQGIFDSDYEALGLLYEKYSDLLFTLVKKILKDEKPAEEILADIFFTVQKRINSFNFNSGNTFTWLVTLAKNRAVYEVRKKNGKIKEESAEIEIEYILPKLSHLTESLDLDKAVELKPNIEAALNKLTDAQQYVIYLSYYEGMTQQEIAEKLKIPQTTVESKIKTALINLNENFKEKSSLFTAKNEIIEMIYPFVLGCLEYEEQIKTFNRFKASEPFPWKLLGEYQNLVSLLPVILELEHPSDEVQTKITEQINNLKNIHKEKSKSFERVTSLTSQLKSEEVPVEIDEIEKDEEIKQETIGKKLDDFEPVVPFKPQRTSSNSDYGEDRKKSYSTIIIIAIIVLFVVSAVLAYLFYQDKTLYYENEIENLNSRLSNLNNEIQNRPEIPGLSELRNSKTIELNNVNGSLSDGKIIFSYSDKRGYLNIKNLPILEFNNAYQLWGNFKGDFISLGVFKVSSRPDYYPFTLPEYVNEGPVEFYLVESNAEGSRKPGSKIYLQGKAE